MTRPPAAQGLAARGVELLFNSVQGVSLTARVVSALGQALAAAEAGRRVHAHALIFSFTEPRIAQAMQALAEHPNATVRVLTDWTQLSDSGGHQAPKLAALEHPRLLLRFKRDRPYAWSEDKRAVVYSRSAGRGLNHHKGLIILRDGQPWQLLTGSFNWSRTADTRNDENLVVLWGDRVQHRAVMRRYALEFEAFWGDGRASLSHPEALRHEALLKEQLAARADDVDVVGLPRGVDQPISLLGDDPGYAPEELRSVNRVSEAELVALGADPSSARAIVQQRELHGPLRSLTAVAMLDGVSAESWQVLRVRLSARQLRVAFSARRPDEARGDGGHAAENEEAMLQLLDERGLPVQLPATLGALALGVIRRARPGESLLLATYGLSPSTPEFKALVATLQRGD